MKYGIRHFYSRSIAFLIALSGLVFLSIPVFASQAAKDKLYVNNGRKDICTAVEATIGQGVSAEDVVKTAIQLGNGPCLVVKCAIYAGGDLKKIIKGAMEAGAKSDVISKCAVDSGANASMVSASLLQAGLNFCYFEPPTSAMPMDVLPKPNPNPPISPASF